ncbi:MAG: polysaccharide deacetylase family protein [Acidobacteriota bacterium]
MRSAALVILAACGTSSPSTTSQQADYLAYDWDARRVLCSDAIDDLEKPVNWPFIDKQLALAGERGWALLLHAHTPGVTVSTDALEHVLSTADANGLAYVTFRDLDASGPPRGGLALSFDDNAPDQWITMRDELTKHGAVVTFFVSRWQHMTAAQHAEIAQLHQDGHDIEPHTVDHPHALAYVQQYGLDAYLADEVLPSFDALTAAGYPPPAAFAYPFGEHDDAIDAAVLEHVDKVRTTPGECPW